MAEHPGELPPGVPAITAENYPFEQDEQWLVKQTNKNCCFASIAIAFTSSLFLISNSYSFSSLIHIFFHMVSFFRVSHYIFLYISL
jgi:hypothetical protein